MKAGARQSAKGWERSRLERGKSGESEFAREGAKPRRTERDSQDWLSSFASLRLERSGRETALKGGRWTTAIPERAHVKNRPLRRN
jgi:hypothetical protein